jgi:hypothetical protein
LHLKDAYHLKEELKSCQKELAVRNVKVDSLQNSLKELDELREFKEVLDLP